MRRDTALPPLRLLQSALRRTTETLAAELAQPTHSAPDWSDLEWRTARAVAAIHGVSPLLSTSLLWNGPPAWRKFIDEQRDHTRARHYRIQEFLGRLDRRMSADGISGVALKGAALHALEVYAPGERPMADIDLLVHKQHEAAMIQALRAHHYHEAHRFWKHRTFVPDEAPPNGALGEHTDNPINIELHSQLREILPLRATDISEWVLPVQSRPGLQSYPSRPKLLGHLLLHAAGAMAYRMLRLIQLHDISLLGRAFSDAEWREFLQCGADRSRGLWWALPPLALTARYYPASVPPFVLADLVWQCPRILRQVTRRQCLSDVSLSRICIEAFPGIEWAQSVRETLDYVARRIKPDEETLDMRLYAARTQDCLAVSPWAHLSQHRRVLRWVVSRPAREATMHAIRAAFAPPPQ